MQIQAIALHDADDTVIYIESDLYFDRYFAFHVCYARFAKTAIALFRASSESANS